MSNVPTRFRCALDIKKGYEVKFGQGYWLEVTHFLPGDSPLDFVSMEFSDETSKSFDPSERILSRPKIGE
jgi:hypothetical protein